jgi:hypothetical protein
MGILSLLPCTYFWIGLAVSAIWKNVPWDLGFLMFCILFSVPVSILAAIRWTKRMYLVTAFALSTLLLVGLGLH